MAYGLVVSAKDDLKESRKELFTLISENAISICAILNVKNAISYHTIGLKSKNIRKNIRLTSQYINVISVSTCNFDKNLQSK